MAKTEFNHGAVHEFLVTFAGVGGTEADLTELTKSKKMCGQVVRVLRGFSEVKPKRLLIDLSADPFCPDGWRVEEHIRAKSWKFDAKQIGLYLDPAQGGGSIYGSDLRKALKGKPVLSANVLVRLLQEENRHLIPEEWKGKKVFFWGTLYRDSSGGLYVPCLHWVNGQWCWRWNWLCAWWEKSDPAAVLASPLQP